MLEAIETWYADTHFRSRLEADYAATFDSIAMPWQYEPEGFKLSDGTWYSPDFYLPTAKAWLEVKGDHNERLDKVERFAADLWEEFDSLPKNALDNWEPYEHPRTPMVILATSPFNPWGTEQEYRAMGLPELTSLRWNFLGIRGPGKRYSLGVAKCQECNQVTFVTYWVRPCRACGYGQDDGLDWMDSVHDYLNHARFVRLPRPAGSSRR